MKKIIGFISLILILLCILFITKDTLSISEWYNRGCKIKCVNS